MATAPALTHFTASPETIDHVTEIVCAIRPSWDPALVRLVLNSHRAQVNGSDLAIAALRCAADERMPYAKSIGWRGPHWDGLETMPLNITAPTRCQTCGKPEPRCYSERHRQPNRPELDDDHAFEPSRSTVAR